MSENKVLQITSEDAKYLDPNQIASIQMVDGTTIIVKGNEGEEGFVEEAQQDEQQYETQDAQEQQPQNLRGRGVLGALAGAALLGTAAAIGGAALRRPAYGYGYGYGYGRPMMMAPPPRPMMRGPMMGPRRPMGLF